MPLIQKHCPECGAALIEKPLEREGIVPYCPACAQYRFPMFNAAVSMITVNRSNGKILLIRQYGRPSFILVAGYINRGEGAEDAVRREIREETGMTVSALRFNRTRFFEPSNTLMCNFTAYVDSDADMSPNDEIDSFAWFTPEEARANIAQGSLAEAFLRGYLEDEANIK